MANCRLWSLPKYLDIHILGSLLLFILLSCSLVFLYMILLHYWLCACLVFLYFYLFCSCLDSQSAMNSCGRGVYSVLVSYLCIHRSILWKPIWQICNIFLEYCYQQFVVCEGSFLGHVVYLVLLFLICCNISLHLSDFCLWMLLVTALCCQVLPSLGTVSIFHLQKTSSNTYTWCISFQI